MYKLYKHLQRIDGSFHIRNVNEVQKIKSLCAFQRCISSSSENDNRRWNRAIMEAEKFVGYPALIFGLQQHSLPNALQLFEEIRKVIGSTHPLLKTIKRLVYNSRTNLQIRALIVLLTSKAAGVPKIQSSHSNDLSVVHSNQKQLAHVTEMIHSTNVIHQSIINLSNSSSNETNIKDIMSGNKIAILMGDYLLAQCCLLLSELGNSEVLTMMGMATKNSFEGEFIFYNEKLGQTHPTALTTLRDWEAKTHLSCGSLLAHSCVSAMMLAAHDKTIQQTAYKFGNQFGLAWQVFTDLQPFVDDHYKPGTSFDLFSLPIILHLRLDPTILNLILPYSEMGVVNYSELRSLVNNGPSIDEAKGLGKKYAQDAASILQGFNKSEARNILENIINSMVTNWH